MTRVGIFTTNSVDKIHPRIQMEKEILEKSGFVVDIIRTHCKKDSSLWEFFNSFTLKYFKWGAIYSFNIKLNDYDIIHVYDLRLLPLVKKARRLNKRVIYETLDDNVYLHFHELVKRIGLIKIFKKIITGIVEKYEYKTSENCDKIIVNSPNLLTKFPDDKVVYIPYSSPLEGIKMKDYNESNPFAFLYLGKLTESKGSRVYEELLKQFNLPLYFFGKAHDSFSNNFVQTNKNVICKGNLDSGELKNELLLLSDKFNLIGLSVILPENESYKWQEANKDIDYMALGIPFIGNDRPPTYEKIKNGAGVLFDDIGLITKLVDGTSGLYESCKINLKKLYIPYRKDSFSDLLIDIYYLLKN